MKEVDYRKLNCPQPVILSKKELDKMDLGQELKIIVDNEVAFNNLSKFIKSSGSSLEKYEIDGEDYHLIVKKGEAKKEEKIQDQSLGNTIAISKDKMGQGDDQLGEILIKSFIYTVRETDPLPENIVFYNSGVKLVTEEGQILEDLKYLESQGVKLMVCGTCLNFFDLKDKVKVGEIGNMYSIYELMKDYRTINI